MTSVQFDDIREDLEAFADDDQEVVVDRSGQCVIVRGGEEINFRLRTDDTGALFADLDGIRVPYKDFISHNLGNLGLLAERIVAKRSPAPPYVDTPAELRVATSENQSGRGLDLLDRESSAPPPFVSRVLFVTADAGQGKTALLRQYQFDQAQRFLAGGSSFVFWHVDLQGRQLLRLSEALLGDLGDLRVAGLWMPAIVRLLRHGSLVLAIDGFDELAAEQGGNDALGALALLVRQMQDRGTIVAASRRTFFDTDDYITRARLFSRAGGGDCQFDQLSLGSWSESEGIQYLEAVEIEGKRFDDGRATYAEIVEALGSAEHTMLTRPFLLAQVARALLRFDMLPGDFIRGMDDPYRGVRAVIEAFVDREVTEKWKQRDTGEPYLDKDQHLRLLADVAEEMYRSQSASLGIDVVETIATILLDEWSVDQARSQQILEMVRMHVLLTPPDDEYGRRSFDHEEFQAWFTAYALKDLMLRVGDGRTSGGADLLSVAQLSEATASYICALSNLNPARVQAILSGLTELIKQEWRPTYLQPNVGTLVPHLLQAIEPSKRIVVDGAVVYSSLGFENSKLRNVTIRGGSFVNASFIGADWADVAFEDCALGEPVFTADSTNLADVLFRNCQIDGVRTIDEEGTETRHYAPERIRAVLKRIGVKLEDMAQLEDAEPDVEPVDGEVRKLSQRILNIFRRTTIVPQSKLEARFPRDRNRVENEIVPMMVADGVLEEKNWRGSGNQKAWGLTTSLLEIERADGKTDHPLALFWQHVDELDRS